MIAGFKITITITTDDVPDVLTLGRRLRDAEDGDGGQVSTDAEAVTEVAWLFAAAGADEFSKRTGLHAEIDGVKCRRL